MVLYLYGDHIFQSCFLRNWPLVSADYRKLPQTKSPEIPEDAKAAYEFMVERVPQILGRRGRCENVVVVEQSAGTYENLNYKLKMTGEKGVRDRADASQPLHDTVSWRSRVFYFTMGLL